jgi:hypothetical protein
MQRVPMNWSGAGGFGQKTAFGLSTYLGCQSIAALFVSLVVEFNAFQFT